MFCLNYKNRKEVEKMGLGAKGFGVLRSRMVKLENQLHKEHEEAKKKGSSKKAEKEKK